MKISTKYSFPLIFSIFLTVAPLLFSSVVTIMVIANESQIALFDWKDWTLITIIGCLTSTFAFTPPTLLALIFGYFIGWHAVLPIFAMNMVAIFLVNFVAKKLDGEKFKSYLSDNKNVSSVLENIRKQELKFIFFTKLSPVMPFALTNFVFALSGAQVKNIIIGGFFGMIPRTALAIWTGSQAKEIRRLLENPNEGNVQKILIILLVIFSVGGILYFVLPKKATA